MLLVQVVEMKQLLSSSIRVEEIVGINILKVSCDAISEKMLKPGQRRPSLIIESRCAGYPKCSDTADEDLTLLSAPY